MSALNIAKKVDLLVLCDDLGPVVSKNRKRTDLMKLITESENYDKEFGKEWFEVITERSEKWVEERKLEADREREN